MTIRIEITDVTNEDKASLVRLAKYLLESAGHQMVYQMPKDHGLKPIPKEGIPAEPTIAPIKTNIDKIETLTRLDAEVKEKVKRKKTTEDIGKQNEDIKPPNGGGYEHCAVPIPPVTQMNFNTFMTRATALRREEKITDLDLLNIVRKHGLDKTHMLSVNPDLVPLVNADLDKFLEGK